MENVKNKMTKTEKEIVEEIMKRYEDGEIEYVDKAIAEGIKAGRKQLADKYDKIIDKHFIDEQNMYKIFGAGEDAIKHIINRLPKSKIDLMEKLQKEAEQ